jgi:hypothetical protein
VVNRLKVAIRVDEADRANRKATAESSWAARSAQELGLDEVRGTGLHEADHKCSSLEAKCTAGRA